MSADAAALVARRTSAYGSLEDRTEDDVGPEVAGPRVPDSACDCPVADRQFTASFSHSRAHRACIAAR